MSQKNNNNKELEAEIEGLKANLLAANAELERRRHDEEVRKDALAHAEALKAASNSGPEKFAAKVAEEYETKQAIRKALQDTPFESDRKILQAEVKKLLELISNTNDKVMDFFKSTERLGLDATGLEFANVFATQLVESMRTPFVTAKGAYSGLLDVVAFRTAAKQVSDANKSQQGGPRREQ